MEYTAQSQDIALRGTDSASAGRGLRKKQQAVPRVVGHQGTRKKQQAVPRFAGHQCSFCSKTWESAYAMRRHETSHTGNKPFVCDQCPRTFSQEANLKVHVESIHTMTKYACPICFQMLSSASCLSHHVKKTHATCLGTYCDQCNTWMRGDLPRHQATDTCKKNRVVQKNDVADRMKLALWSIEEDEVADAMCGFN